MNKFTIFVVAIFGAVLVASAARHSDTEYIKMFTMWKKDFNKEYQHDVMWSKFQTFKANLDKIEEHNEKGDFQLALNEFADLSADEFKSMYLNSKVPDFSNGEEHKMRMGGDLPDSVDWRTKGAVTGVKNQGQCGSCWSFSTTGSTEGAHFLAGNTLVGLSEQNLVDCSGNYGNMGCNGGLMSQAFQYIIDNGGIDTEASYPYQGVDGSCQFSQSNVGATISSYKNITSGDESNLQDASANAGPVSVAIDASQFSFQFYSKGVYYESSCGNKMDDLDHGVLVVGYGTDKGKDYWIVKNSWGASWGQSGYIWMSRNRDNNCGIATCASYPVV